MPAIVKGGRRQASQRAGNAQKGAIDEAPQSRSGAMKPRRAQSIGAGRMIIGKHQAVGAVPIPPEIMAWLGFIATVILLSAVLFTGGRAQKLQVSLVGSVDGWLAQAGFQLQKVHLKGASVDAQKDIEAVMGLRRGQPLALMDLKLLRQKILSVGWVKDVTVRRQLPGSLWIEIVQKQTLAVWNLNGQLFVINEDGDIIREARPDLYLNLPLVSGDGANKHASEILAMITTRPALMERVYALVRVDTRRWDIVLKDNSVIKLPALNPERALENLDRYIAKEKILDQGFAYIDLRDPESVAVLDWEEAKARHLSPPPIDGSDLLASQTPPPPPPPPPA